MIASEIISKGWFYTTVAFRAKEEESCEMWAPSYEGIDETKYLVYSRYTIKAGAILVARMPKKMYVNPGDNHTLASILPHLLPNNNWDLEVQELARVHECDAFCDCQC